MLELHLRAEPRLAALQRGWRESAISPPLVLAAAQLREYFAGQRREFELPLSLIGTTFQRQVWNALLAIPFGVTCSYGDIARRIDVPGSARAVGLANNRNPIPIIVPCHRVINADGSLGGFGGGVGMKQWLLQHEGAPASAQLDMPWC